MDKLGGMNRKAREIFSYRKLGRLLPEEATQSKFAFWGHVIMMASTWRLV